MRKVEEKASALGIYPPICHIYRPPRRQYSTLAVQMTFNSSNLRRLSLRGLLGVATLVAIVAGVIDLARAQNPSGASVLSFEVASIKSDHSGSTVFLFGFPAGRFTVTNATPKTLVAWAYNVSGPGFQVIDDRISEGPAWISGERYDLEAKEDNQDAKRLAKLPAAERNDQIRLMVQSLLADRFKLRVHHEIRELPAYALVVAKNGPKVIESTKEASVRTRTGEITASGVPVRVIAEMLSRQAPSGCAPPELEGHEVRDETGLSGVYDFTLKWTPEPRVPSAADSASPPETTGPSIFTALEEQLGLRLESTKAPVDVLVIDQIQEPTPN